MQDVMEKYTGIFIYHRNCIWSEYTDKYASVEIMPFAILF